MSTLKHVVQSKEWGDFKTKFGTTAVRVGEVQYTIHKVPKTGFNYAYCPKVNPDFIDWEPLEKSLKENKCFVINFDVPYVIKGTEAEKKALDIFSRQGNKVKKASKNTFTKNNIILSLEKSEKELFENMHKKHRYNVRYAHRKGVEVRFARTSKDFDTFFDLMEKTAKRQKFLIHPKKYYKMLWEVFAPREMAEILIAEYEKHPLAAWMLFVYEGILYYPYGASSDTHRNLFASNVLGWESMRYGKRRGCKLFDMWGASKDINNEDDPEWGFTNFKMKFGGKYIEYMDSYDYVLNPFVYNTFNFVYPKILKALKTLK